MPGKNQHSRGGLLTKTPQACLMRYIENATALTLDGKQQAAPPERNRWEAVHRRLVELRQEVQRL